MRTMFHNFFSISSHPTITIIRNKWFFIPILIFCYWISSIRITSRAIYIYESLYIFIVGGFSFNSRGGTWATVASRNVTSRITVAGLATVADLAPITSFKPLRRVARY